MYMYSSLTRYLSFLSVNLLRYGIAKYKYTTGKIAKRCFETAPKLLANDCLVLTFFFNFNLPKSLCFIDAVEDHTEEYVYLQGIDSVLWFNMKNNFYCFLFILLHWSLCKRKERLRK